MIVLVWLMTVAASLLPLQLPPANTMVDYQLGGAYQPAKGVKVVIRDMAAKPAKGIYSVCYVNAFQTQPGRLAWWKSKHRNLLLADGNGRLVRDKGWPDEVLLDLRTKAKRAELAAITNRWLGSCARKGFRAVEPDNLDSWTRSAGLLKRSDAVKFARLLIDQAHRHGLAIAQKNAAELASRKLGFDFAVVEECEVYRECGRFLKAYGTHIIEIEYTDNGRAAFARACRERGAKTSILLRDRDLVPRGHTNYTYETC